jgi:ubiquinone/menaquinone biosynthesis C-methylase UbiE
MHVSASVPDDWYRWFFSETYRRADLDRQPDSKTAMQVDCVLRELHLPPGARVLDLACGTGRHSLRLAAAGMDVVGIDLNETYVDEAEKTAQAQGLAARFQQADMRDLSFLADRSFDAVVSMHTSFGLFHDENDNRLVLVSVARLLRPGGRLLVDLLNRDWLLKTVEPAYFVPVSQQTVSRDFDFAEPGVVLHERTFNPLSSRLRWTITPSADPDAAAVAEWRIYSAHEIVSLVNDAGLMELRLIGDYQGAVFHATAPRLICLATKPEA